MYTIFSTYFLFCVITNAITVEDTITHTITHPYQKCNGKTNIKNTFDARITTVKSDKSYQGTLLMVPGGTATQYIGAFPSGEKEGQKSLMSRLWNEGFRILEIQWDYSVSSDSRYQDSYSCPMYGVAQALQYLKDENIGSTSNKWWPSSKSDRYAFGTSSGQVALSFAIDKWTESFTEMNRVVFGGGGVGYDLFEIIDCTQTGYDVPLEKVEFLYNGATEKCGGDRTCDGDNDLANALDEASLQNYIGTSDDSNRANKVLFNTGNDSGCNHDLNVAYYNDRYGTAGTDKRLWDLEGTWCNKDIWGHSMINPVFDERNHVDEWFNFIKDGTMAASVSCT